MSAYTRKTGKKALVLRTLWGGGGGHSVHVTGLTAVPVSKVLRELPCDRCGREIERGEYVLRERDVYGFRTTCDLCSEWIAADELFGRSEDSA